MPQDKIDELLLLGVLHLDRENARDIDRICNTESLKCLSWFTLYPFFVDHAYNVALCLAKRELDHLRGVIDTESQLCRRLKLSYNFDKSNLDIARKEQLEDLISRLESAAKSKEKDKERHKALGRTNTSKPKQFVEINYSKVSSEQGKSAQTGSSQDLLARSLDERNQSTKTLDGQGKSSSTLGEQGKSKQGRPAKTLEEKKGSIKFLKEQNRSAKTSNEPDKSTHHTST